MHFNKVDWKNDENHILLNPRFSDLEKNYFLELQKSAPQMHGIIWLASSGSTSSQVVGQKLIALSKESILMAAQASNDHLQVTSKDKWLQILPRFHIGGLSIEARSFLSGSQIISYHDQKWSPLHFAKILESEKITLASLVPTQIYDLVQLELKAPSSLRAILVGGGSLPHNVYFKARELGWPLLPTFGMTECCSQVATAELSSLQDLKNYPMLKKLSHIEIAKSTENLLKIKSPSLLQGLMYSENGKSVWKNPLENNWYTTEDTVEILGDYLKPLGRINDVIKVSGELVNLNFLREVLSQVLESLQIDEAPYALMSKEDSRLGQKVVLVHENQKQAESVKNHFNSLVLPFERVQEIILTFQIPRTELGKVLYNRIKFD